MELVVKHGLDNEVQDYFTTEYRSTAFIQAVFENFQHMTKVVESLPTSLPPAFESLACC